MIRKLALAAVVLLLLAPGLGDHSQWLPEPGSPAPLAPAVAPEPLPAAESGAPLDKIKASTKTPPVVSPGVLRAPARLVKIKELEPAVKKYASQHGVDEDLVWAVMRHESGFNPRAVSPKGAMGLMQLMPGTASLMGVTDPFDVDQNVAGGIRYLEYCLSQFHQDIALALAAYNAGPQNVTKYQGCPPFPETRQYVAAVLQTYGGHPQYRRGGLAYSVTEEVSALLDKVGLHWRVPLPQWKLREPQFHLKTPQWKGAQANLVNLAR